MQAWPAFPVFLVSLMLTDFCAEFLLELLGFRLDEVETLWFFSDWSDAASPRDFAQRLSDLCLSRVLSEP